MLGFPSSALGLVCLASLISPPHAFPQGVEGVSPLCADRPAVTGRQTRSAIGSGFGRPASDLYCIDLHDTPAAPGAVGVVELGRPATPFGSALTSQGHHVSVLTAWIAGLPEPSSLGPYTTYVAWATTPVLDPVEKLGEVTNGRNALGRVEFDKFMILITGERAADVPSRVGRLVLRGRSPSSLMEAHDLLAQAPSALDAGGDPSNAAQVGAWTMPPRYPGIAMLPGVAGLAPAVAPLRLPADSVGALPDAGPRQVVRLSDGGTLDLEAAMVRRRLGDRMVPMLAFNGQHPGPLIQVAQHTTIFVNLVNRSPFPTTVHWHGIRLDNRFDGVPGVTQDAVQPGKTFRYQIYFPDAGIYWYHPHHREDIQQELGLYGNLLVESPRRDYYGPANREEVLMVDDVLLGGDGLVAFGDQRANFALMGRFGNFFLVNGEPAYDLQVRRGEVVRFHFTNVANTRTFNISFVSDASDPPLPLKVVGSDVGKFERETWAENVVIAPAERYTVDVRFPTSGTYRLVNRVQAIDHRAGTFFPEASSLGSVAVQGQATGQDHGHAFEVLRENADVIADIDRYRSGFDRPVDHELVLTMAVDGLPSAVQQTMLWDGLYFNPVEWAGTMPMMNWVSTGREVRWILRDPATDNENEAIRWRFHVGDVVKIRLYNERDAFHAMQHPLHIHGQRFLILEQNGVPNDNLVWKDTVLLPTGSTTDILLELSNPGRWMVHCHIAEHLESGMKFVFDVEE